jgi:hypothetical protein
MRASHSARVQKRRNKAAEARPDRSQFVDMCFDNPEPPCRSIAIALKTKR